MVVWLKLTKWDQKNDLTNFTVITSPVEFKSIGSMTFHNLDSLLK